ncbi:DUF4382 domain-containing protein [Sphingobacterium sp. SYP-B4668]|uniref:DUF4382 domain-containing protein n=1 Tax=Sphingobacterium sp. SYP-B4668 TaxID=2996035 RepID=UPI0022DD8EDF|nr:DUF4382 domain-containing protein [Sphingobacterium sp. SYP-B4668]
MKKYPITAIIASLLLLSSCSTDESPAAKTTPLTIKMTDAPGYYDAIHLNIDEIEIRTSGGNKTIDIDGNPFDILKFTMGRDTVIAGADVPAGRIQEIRLKLEDEGNQIWVDNIAYPLKTPSGQSSGVKIKIQEDLIPNVAYTLLLDFDASKSIHQTGNGAYVLKPVIRAIPVATSGAITGMITPATSLAHVFAINGTDTVGTLANPLGNFYFPGITEGKYKILIQPSASDFLDKTIENVEVVKGSVKDLGTISLD